MPTETWLIITPQPMSKIAEYMPTSACAFSCRVRLRFGVALLVDGSYLGDSGKS
jgi:hypothetical protein